jgi:hypothetical protein
MGSLPIGTPVTGHLLVRRRVAREQLRQPVNVVWEHERVWQFFGGGLGSPRALFCLQIPIHMSRIIYYSAPAGAGARTS